MAFLGIESCLIIESGSDPRESFIAPRLTLCLLKLSPSRTRASPLCPTRSSFDNRHAAHRDLGGAAGGRRARSGDGSQVHAVRETGPHSSSGGTRGKAAGWNDPPLRGGGAKGGKGGGPIKDAASRLKKLRSTEVLKLKTDGPNGKPICHFFQRGHCVKGDSCPYPHICYRATSQGSLSSTAAAARHRRCCDRHRCPCHNARV